MAAATAEKLKTQIKKCRIIINKGYTSTRNSGLKWLNEFCAEFLQFSNRLHRFISRDVKAAIEENKAIEDIFLCLSQVVTCIREMEITIKAENATGRTISASRQHFLDRINWCLDRLYNSINLFGKDPSRDDFPPLEECSYLFLMDLVMDNLEPYCTYSNSFTVDNVAEEEAEAMFTSKRVRTMVDLILGHALTFANVALPKDKRPLSALCQIVLHDCMAFQDECALSLKKNDSGNYTDRKVKAISLESSLYRLEDYINEALIRLVYTSFLDYDRCSIGKLRTLMNLSDSQQHCNEYVMDELIADFDVNLDRTMQIGMFAIGFSEETSVKTILRSCLASLESLDAYIIPSLRTPKNTTINLHSEILEQHYNDEIAIFKRNVQEIVDSYAFTSCYYDMLNECITNAEKHFQKHPLEDIIKKGEFLYEHFQVKANGKELHGHQNRMELYEKFTLMLRECQAALLCADRVDTKRIMKRFKILQSVLGKFVRSLETATIDGKPKISAKSKEQIDFDMFPNQDLNDPLLMFEAQGIFTMVSSILYNPMRRRNASDSLKGNYSKLTSSPSFMMLPKEHKAHGAAILPVGNAADDNITQHSTERDHCGITSLQQQHLNNRICPTAADATSKTQKYSAKCSSFIAKSDQHTITAATQKQQRDPPSSEVIILPSNSYKTTSHGRIRSVRRKESLRTAMFKRQKSAETEQIYNSYKVDSASLQISAILENLSSLSSQMSHSLKESSESSAEIFDSSNDSDDVDDVFNTTIIT